MRKIIINLLIPIVFTLAGITEQTYAADSYKGTVDRLYCRFSTPNGKGNYTYATYGPPNYSYVTNLKGLWERGDVFKQWIFVPDERLKDLVRYCNHAKTYWNNNGYNFTRLQYIYAADNVNGPMNTPYPIYTTSLSGRHVRVSPHYIAEK